MSKIYRLVCGAFFLALFSQNPANAQDVILQGFYWNTHPGDVSNTTSGGVWWDTLATVAPQLENVGFNTVWTPPPNKGFAGIWDMGYGPYDYFDLGNLNSKGTTRTRHGSKTEHDNMVSTLHANNLKVMCDAVLNHRGGADAQSDRECQVNSTTTDYNIYNPPSLRIPSNAAHFHPNNTHCSLDGDLYTPLFFQDICHFNQSDANPPTNIDGTPGSWFFGTPPSIGSMGDSLIMWGRWLVSPTGAGYDEFRLDAVKHIDPNYIAKFLVESKNNTQPFAIGESFDYDLGDLTGYLDAVQNSGNDGGIKSAKMSMFDFPLRGALKTVLNTTNGNADLYQTLGSAGLVWGGGRSGFDVVTWLESHDTDRQGYIGATSGCPIPAGASCLELHTENDHDPIVSDKEDMGYPFLMAAEGRPVVFWKDFYWYGMAEDIEWEMNLRKTTAIGTSNSIPDLAGVWPTTGDFDSDNHGGNMFAMRRNGLTSGVSDGMILGLNDHATKKGGVFVNTPFVSKYLKDYSDGFLFVAKQTAADTRVLIETNKRDYSWWSVTGLYPASPSSGSHFLPDFDGVAGSCPHFVAIRAANAANLIVNGAPIAAGDEVAVKNASGAVVGIGRVGQKFQWDGTHDMIIEVLAGSTTNGMANGEAFRVFVFDESANAEIEIGTVQFSATATAFNFSPDRANSPNRNGNFSTFSVTTTAAGSFSCQGISQIVAFNSQAAVNQNVCGSDNANAATYDSWASGDNGGTNFGTWTLSATGNVSQTGFFVGSSASNGDGDGNSDGDINVGGEAWGLYANSSQTTNAVRAFASNLVANSTFSIKMDNGFIDNGATVGFGLQNASGDNLLEFYYRGGDGTNSYKKNDLGGEANVGLGYTDEGLSLTFNFPTATTYTAVLTSVSSGSTVSFSGSLKNPGANGQAISKIRLFNFNAGNGGTNNLFFNNLSVCYPPTLVINEFDYDQPTADNKEFIEIKNVSSAAVNLDNYNLELVDGTGNTVYQTVNLPNVNLAAGDYFVVCGTGSLVANCDFSFSGATDQIQDETDAIRLKLSNLTVDAVSYEGSVAGAVENSGSSLTDGNAANQANLSFSRTPDGDDSDSNNADFGFGCATPGVSNISNSDADGDGVKVCQGDCDDTDANEFPGQTWFVDADGDNFGGSFVVQCERPTNGKLLSELQAGSTGTDDCNDADANVKPGATEIVGDGIDQNCDTQELCYNDGDDDGYTISNPTTNVSTDLDCTDANEEATISASADCNDGNSAVKPGATEIPGDGIDQNCDTQELCYNDSDDDGFTISSPTTLISVDLDCTDANEEAVISASADCNDGNSAVKPGATEIPGDGVDQNCDTQELCYNDGDDDGYTISSPTTNISADLDCTDANEEATISASADCNDANASIKPGATELCNNIDDDCDAMTDENLTQVTLSGVVTNVTSCISNNGAINLTVNSGTPTITFSWSNSATTEDLIGIGTGSYSVTATSSQGCTKTTSFTVGATTSPITLSFSVTNVACNGGSNGTIFTTITGTGPFAYSWSNGKTTKNINLLPLGTYTLTATGAGGCTASASANVTQPTAINFTLSQTGSYNISIAASGGTVGTGYSYNRSGTSGYQSSSTFNGLTAGTYIFKVKDGNGCLKSRIAKVPLVGPKPAANSRDFEWDLTDEEALLPDEVLLAAFESRFSGEKWSVFPNPVAGNLTVLFSEIPEMEGQLSIFDALGKLVRAKNINLENEKVVISERSRTVNLETSHLPQGNYLIVFKSKTGLILQKQFVKM